MFRFGKHRKMDLDQLPEPESEETPEQKDQMINKEIEKQNENEEKQNYRQLDDNKNTYEIANSSFHSQKSQQQIQEPQNFRKNEDVNKNQGSFDHVNSFQGHKGQQSVDKGQDSPYQQFSSYLNHNTNHRPMEDQKNRNQEPQYHYSQFQGHHPMQHDQSTRNQENYLQVNDYILKFF